MWKLLEFFLIASDVELNDYAITHMLELSEDYRLPKRLKETSSSRVLDSINDFFVYNALNTQQLSSGANFDNKDELNLLIEQISLVKNFVVEASRYISDLSLKLPFHEVDKLYCVCEGCVSEADRRAFQSLYVRQTILNDCWYENDKNTRKRSKAVRFMHYTWIVQMGYRILFRREKLLTPPALDEETSPEPIWFNGSDFYGNGFPVYNIDKPIATWTAEELNEALVILLRTRSYNGYIDFMDNNQISSFLEYRQALVDRAAMLLFLVQDGLEETNHPDWYKDVNLVSRFSKLGDDDIILADDHDLAISRQLKEIREQERATNAKDTHEHDDEEEGGGKRVRLMSAKEKMEYVLENRERTKREQMQKDRDTLEKQLDDVKNDETSDLFTLERLKEDLLAVKTNINKMDEISNRGKDEKLKQARERLLTAVENRSTSRVYMTKQWVLDTFLMIDFIQSWQIKNKEYILRPFPPRKNDLEDLLFECLSKALLRNSGEDTIERAQNFVFSHFFCTFPEREMYRIQYTDFTAFNEQEVCSFTRENLVHLDDFPKYPHDLLNTKMRYHSKAMCFLAYWWFGQIMPFLDLDSTIFLWDLELKYCTLDRPKIPTPCISHIGSEFVVLEGPEWDSKSGWLNCTWCGSSFIKAFTHWVCLMSEIGEWTVYDRKTKQTVSIKDTEFYDIISIWLEEDD